jgi:short chain dehydrogenase
VLPAEEQQPDRLLVLGGFGLPRSASPIFRPSSGVILATLRANCLRMPLPSRPRKSIDRVGRGGRKFWFSETKLMAILDRFKLTGKRLFITGGSRGLGREMALAIADAGADVILVGRDPSSLETTAGDIRALGGHSWTIAADVGNPAECEAACKTALDRHGPIDILINNVGGRRENISTESMTLDLF